MTSRSYICCICQYYAYISFMATFFAVRQQTGRQGKDEIVLLDSFTAVRDNHISYGSVKEEIVASLSS